jgi:hypothetical protein
VYSHTLAARPMATQTRDVRNMIFFVLSIIYSVSK